MDLALDVGNTSTKVALFDEGQLIFKNVFKQLTQTQLKAILEDNNPQNAITSSVKTEAVFIDDMLGELNNYIQLDHKTPIPITNNYRTPKTLGMDRLATVVAAASLYKNENVLVIDAGTCIKYDFISNHAIYNGGSIAPGVEMRFKAMNSFTGKLPLIQPTNVIDPPGKTTEEAMQTGVMFAILKEMEGFIAHYGLQHQNLKTIITGGNANYFEHKFKKQIFAHPNLVLLGLNKILQFNAA